MPSITTPYTQAIAIIDVIRKARHRHVNRAIVTIEMMLPSLRSRILSLGSSLFISPTVTRSLNSMVMISMMVLSLFRSRIMSLASYAFINPTVVRSLNSMVMMKMDRRRCIQSRRPQAVTKQCPGARLGVRFRRFASPVVALGGAFTVLDGMLGLVLNNPTFNSACALCVYPTLAAAARAPFSVMVRGLLSRRRRGPGGGRGWLHYNGSLILTSAARIARIGGGVDASLRHSSPELDQALPSAPAPLRPVALRSILDGHLLLHTVLGASLSPARGASSFIVSSVRRGSTCSTISYTGVMRAGLSFSVASWANRVTAALPWFRLARSHSALARVARYVSATPFG